MAASTSKLSVSEALRQIAAGTFELNSEVDFDYVKVEALHVLQLAKHGVAVPEDCIVYDDAAIDTGDADYAGPWVRSAEKVPADEVSLTVELRLPADLAAWLAEQPVAAGELVGALLRSAYGLDGLLRG